MYIEIECNGYIHRYATRGRSFCISLATRRIGAMDWREEGTTSLSKTSIEKVVVAALRDGRRVSDDGPTPPTSIP